MATKEEYAALSAIVYNNARGKNNKLTTLPAGWSPLSLDPSNSITGFTAAAFINDQSGEIVIAYKGTDSGDLVQMAQDFLTGNIPLALGGIPLPGYLSILSKLPAFQMYEAALFYEQVKMAAQIGANISFTGHSLGGGLASLMAVLFERQATTFAQAPFELTALNYGMISGLSDFLADNNFQDSSLPSSLLDYLNNYLPSYSAREAGVTNYVVPGEVLSKYLVMFPNIIGANHPIVVGGTEQIASDTLHSILLHTALLMSQTFENDTVLLTQLLTEIFDTNLYASPSLRGEIPDFLNHLLNDQIKVGYDNADGLLARFAGDLDKLTQYGANIKDGALGKALLDIAIADYYFMQNGFSGRDFFNAITGGIGFDLSDIQSSNGWATNKTVTQLDTAIINQYLNGDQTARSFLTQDNYWSIQSGADALVATGTGTNNDAMIGGTTDDLLDGAAGNDFLLGGDGADTLTGGIGYDLLEGGAGSDTYYASLGDNILDADGLGSVYRDNVKLTGGSQNGSANNFISVDSAHTYTLFGDQNAAEGATLIIDGSLTIQNYHAGELGITLEGGTPPALVTLSGVDDPAKMTSDMLAGSAGADYLMHGWAGNDILFNGNTTGNDQMYGDEGHDILKSGGGNDQLYGGIGNDTLQGGDGSDYLEGNAGNDFMDGGAGSDVLYGGDGHDFMWGGASLYATITYAQLSDPSAIGFNPDYAGMVSYTNGQFGLPTGWYGSVEVIDQIRALRETGRYKAANGNHYQSLLARSAA